MVTKLTPDMTKRGMTQISWWRGGLGTMTLCSGLGVTLSVSVPWWPLSWTHAMEIKKKQTNCIIDHRVVSYRWRTQI